MLNRVMVSLIFLMGCSDYNLFSGDKQVDAETVPSLMVNPERLDAGVVCADVEQQETITLSNVGTEPLEITTLEMLGDWQVIQDPTPITIPIQDSISFQVAVGTTDSTLVIGSNDPLNDLLQIPLDSQLDEPPTIEIVTPIDGGLVNATTVFEANVTDDLDPTEYLMVQWTSNRDGLFSTGEARSNGTVVTQWDQYHNSGYHRIQAMVFDSCGNSAEDTINVCQPTQYHIDELDISTWHFEGQSTWDSTNDWLQLTTPSRYVVGTAFSTGQEVPGGQVEIEFSFYIGDGTGADGISLTALDVDRMTTFLGGDGCGIGYGGDAPCTPGPALPGWSVEVDTYFNDGYDPTASDHVMFTFDGDVDSPQVWAELPEMEDTGWHTMRVLVREPYVLVEIDGVAYIDQDIVGFYGFDAYVGFTAGTGDFTNSHLIDGLVVTEQTCFD